MRVTRLTHWARLAPSLITASPQADLSPIPRFARNATVPPTDVRVVQSDGSEDPVELVYPGRGVDGIHSRFAVPTSPFLAPDDHAKGDSRPRDIARRAMVVTPVAAVMAALDRKWPDWPGWRDRRRGAIRDAMYAE